jgi:hypothetical protein
MRVPNECRLRSGAMASDDSYGNNGIFHIPRPDHVGKYFMVIASDGEGWEHVSVSLPSRTPTWDEMCYIKQIFWGDDECVVQYHPPKTEYVNNHETCLHLWKQVGQEFNLPPSILVGIK